MLFEYSFKNKVQNIKKKPEVASSDCRLLHSDPEPLLLEYFGRLQELCAHDIKGKFHPKILKHESCVPNHILLLLYFSAVN